MRSVTIKLPEPLLADIEAEGRRRNISKSDVMRERLERGKRRQPHRAAHLDAIADLIGSVEDDLPADLSSRKKHYLRTILHGRKHHR
jgi:Arc/MetJ-type ribon-helix-helix transcriptional regulator